ncbi:MAG: hypothetical protein JWO08_1834 [Verrucomicrobiaceae bacterium]|nr:hypothetical protein [Verrucomicrobiaceae bacterium]
MHKHTLALASLLLTTAAFATPSGLNNIPTADTPPQGTVVIQGWTNFGNDYDADFNMGFKTGFDVFGQKLEFGADSHLFPDKGGPVVVQFKYVQNLWKGGQLALGIANLGLTSELNDRAGDPFSYALLSQDVCGLFRAHAGFGFQTQNNSVLLGLDKTVKVLDRDLQLRTDFVQIQDQNQWLGSLGFLYALHKNFVIEAWASQPLDHGETIYTAKFNIVFNF